MQIGLVSVKILLLWQPQMSKNYLNQILDDKEQNRYLFILFLFTLFFGITGVLCIMALPGVIFLSSNDFNQLLRPAFCSCSTYPVAVAFGLGTAWYLFRKKRYALIFAIMLIPLCNLLVAVGLNIAGY